MRIWVEMDVGMERRITWVQVDLLLLSAKNEIWLKSEILGCHRCCATMVGLDTADGDHAVTALRLHHTDNGGFMTLEVERTISRHQSRDHCSMKQPKTGK